MRDGITIHCYLPNLSDEDLDCLRQLFLRGADRAPVFSHWMVDLMTDEQLRRVLERAAHRTPRDVEPVVIPTWRMNGRDIADALQVVTCVSFAADLSPAGCHLLDSLVHAVNGLAAVRLESMEANYAGTR